MQNNFSVNKEITRKDFEYLQAKVSAAMTIVYNFGVHNISPKGRVKKEMQEIYDQVEVERKKWEMISSRLPSAEASSLILKHMRNIVKLGSIHDGLLTEHLAKLRR